MKHEQRKWTMRILLVYSPSLSVIYPSHQMFQSLYIRNLRLGLCRSVLLYMCLHEGRCPERWSALLHSSDLWWIAKRDQIQIQIQI
ncbi:hypothetical protein Hanom_Chr10g00914961 [Helianthus anomalus]